MLEDICAHVVSLGGDSIEVSYEDGEDWVYAGTGGTGVSIAHYKPSSHEGKELRDNLYAAARKPVRTVIDGRVYLIKASIFESFGEDAFSVSIRLAPKLDPSTAPSFTAKQGQYLAYIYHYTKIHRRPPAESDLQGYFRVSPPSVHDMIKTLQRNGLIERTPGQVRSIRLCVKAEDLPRLE